MNSHDRNRLLREMLDDSGVDELRRDSLQRTLAYLRGRRQRRRRVALAGACLAICALAAISGNWLRRAGESRRDEIARGPASTPAAAAATTAPAPRLPTRVISDEELFALFPDRSVALIGAPGEQRLVFLDTLSSAASRPR